jgi:coenzyme F420-reducing hydrogenase alpha subunit
VSPAGSILIDLYHRSGTATGVKIASNRPDGISQVLIGKPPEQVLDTIPLLFALCGNAQAYAALQACRAALDIAANPDMDAARDMLVRLETLREHAWRILLDWPGFLDLASDKKALAALLKFDALFKRNLFRHGEAFKLDSRLDIDIAQLTRLINELETLIDATIFNDQLAGFLQLNTEQQLRNWMGQNDALPANLLNYLYNQDWAAAGQNDIACLPELGTNALNKQMQQQDSASFSHAPHWQGCCFEATLLNRQISQPLVADLHNHYKNGLLTRMLARLMEIALVPSQLRQLLVQITDKADLPSMNAPNEGIGLAQVQAARGLLIHRLELHQGRVCDYCIVAPTEWNFHPEGVVAEGLKQLQAENSNDLQRQAELFISAVDPCVQYALNLTDSHNGTETHA